MVVSRIDERNTIGIKALLGPTLGMSDIKVDATFPAIMDNKEATNSYCCSTTSSKLEASATPVKTRLFMQLCMLTEKRHTNSQMKVREDINDVLEGAAR